MMKQKHFKWLALAVFLLTGLSLQTRAQGADDLQEYLDKLTAEQPVQQSRQGMREKGVVTIPVGLPEVDLSKFSSSTNRTSVLVVKSSVKLINGTLSAGANFAGAKPLMKIQDGVTCVVAETAAVDASAASISACTEAVGIYGGSTFYQCGDVTAPKKTGVAIYLSSARDTYIYVSGKTIGSISNPYGGTVTGLETYQDLKDKLDAIEEAIQLLMEQFNTVKNNYTSLKVNLSAASQQKVDAQLTAIDATLRGFKEEKDGLAEQLETAATSTYSSLNTRIDDLANRVENYRLTLIVELNKLSEDVKAQAVSELQKKLTDFQNDVTKLQAFINDIGSDLRAMGNGQYFFERRWTEKFRQDMAPASQAVQDLESNLKSLVSNYNDLLRNNSIVTVEDAISFGQQLEQLKELLYSLQEQSGDARTLVDALKEQYNALEVNFPNSENGYTVAPTGINLDIQLGYKSNRGFVLTSSGIMYFEQVSGATFRLKNQDDVYLVATKGSSKLTAGTEETATVWTGRSLGNGSYTFYSSSADRYITAGVGRVHEPVTAGTALQWTIVESELDPLQALLNGLAEDEAEGESGGGTLTQNDTLRIKIPKCNCDYVPGTIRFPVVPYPILIKGDEIPIPTPNGGKRPQNYHPYHIPVGSHVILDDVTFRDMIGGDHVIYVEGVIEINIKVKIYIWNWDWFIHVGPTGRVIWRYTPEGEYIPRIKNDRGGTIDMSGGRMGHLDNSGTVNHTSGTIDYVINRYVYHFKGGLINYMDNYGTSNHSGGQAGKIRNNTGGTYEMTGGEIRNTVVTVVDTVFINCGTFNFRGGYLCGYGSRLIYHAKGAKMRIDGGMFCFDHIKDYWIEAHDEFYIRGDEDYQPTVPILLHPSVRIRILYKWIYKFKIVFIGGRPTPRYPLFTGEEGLRLSKDYYWLIDWQLPNSRWRWYYKDDTNSIEPRDEQVEDEDDLQSYIDWLSKHQDGESASKEEKPQVLDLGGRIIYITRRIDIPVGSHVWFKNGQFVPSGTWTDDRVFRIPSGSSVRFENFVIDFSSSVHYYVNARVVYRYIFDVAGNVYFGPGFHVKGWFDPSIASTDNYWPGAVFRFDPSARIYLNGGRFDNIIFLLNKVVNIYVSARMDYNIYCYLPTDCRYDSFRFMAPWNHYSFVQADLEKVKFVVTDQWKTATDEEGYATIVKPTGVIIAGDINGNGEVDDEDVDAFIELYLDDEVPEAGTPEFDNFDANGDGELTLADAVAIFYLSNGLNFDGTDPNAARAATPMDNGEFLLWQASQRAERIMDNYYVVTVEATELGNGIVRYTLTSDFEYAGFAIDVKGAQVVSESAEDMTLRSADTKGKHRIVAYNFGQVASAGTVLTLDVLGEAQFSNINFSDANARNIRFRLSEATGIGATPMDNGQWIMDHYYDLQGREKESLKKGVNILRHANGKAMKVSVK